MSRHAAPLNYPVNNYHLIFQSSSNLDEYYGLDELERKKLNIVQAKYGCRHCFHNLPDNVSLDLHKFVWNEETSSFEIQPEKVKVQLNTLEEAIVEYFTGDLS